MRTMTTHTCAVRTLVLTWQALTRLTWLCETCHQHALLSNLLVSLKFFKYEKYHHSHILQSPIWGPGKEQCSFQTVSIQQWLEYKMYVSNLQSTLIHKKHTLVFKKEWGGVGGVLSSYLESSVLCPAGAGSQITSSSNHNLIVHHTRGRASQSCQASGD